MQNDKNNPSSIHTSDEIIKDILLRNYNMLGNILSTCITCCITKSWGKYYIISISQVKKYKDMSYIPKLVNKNRSWDLNLAYRIPETALLTTVLHHKCSKLTVTKNHKSENQNLLKLKKWSLKYWVLYKKSPKDIFYSKVHKEEWDKEHLKQLLLWHGSNQASMKFKVGRRRI